jgi:hypothetical protein
MMQLSMSGFAALALFFITGVITAAIIYRKRG